MRLSTFSDHCIRDSSFLRTGTGRFSNIGVATSPGHKAAARMPFLHSFMLTLSLRFGRDSYVPNFSASASKSAAITSHS